MPLKTVLDEFHTTFLHAAVYAAGELRVVVAEGFRAADSEDVVVLGHVLGGSYGISTSAESRLVEVRFRAPVAWQLVAEQFTLYDESEALESGRALQVLTRSGYLDYVRAHHGWFEDIRGPGKHYRAWTEGEVVDVVACEPPTVGLTAGT